ncbi:MAG: outer membrane beta-barrel protein [Prevotellaceae bacterium]|jgi:hypothetical protein|nr:outer membrane beta-barrel protein [Prevotellaceae bacterium]MDY3856843.1 outer membrane beta-barrel protein [Bacteroidaceae bacterium]
MLRPKFRLLLLLALLPLVGIRGQVQRVQYRPYVDLKKFHYGFFIGLHDESLRLINNGYVDPATGRQWFVDNDQFNPNFTVGLVGEWRLSQYFALRLLPTMHFGNKHLTFRDQVSGDQQYQDLKSTYIACGVHLKFTPPRINNYRPYLTAGLTPMYDLTVKDQENIQVKPFNLMLELGLGLERYLPYFKFIPEIKFCFGLLDILEKDRSSLRDESKKIFTQSVDKGKTNMVVLSFYFE